MYIYYQGFKIIDISPVKHERCNEAHVVEIENYYIPCYPSVDVAGMHSCLLVDGEIIRINGWQPNVNDSLPKDFRVVFSDKRTEPIGCKAEVIYNDITGDAIYELSSVYLSPYEIAIRGWSYPEYAKRIIAPKSLSTDPVGIAMYVWFQVNGLPVVPMPDGTVQMYCNEILEEHNAIIQNLQGVITIEDRPVPPTDPTP